MSRLTVEERIGPACRTRQNTLFFWQNSDKNTARQRVLASSASSCLQPREDAMRKGLSILLRGVQWILACGGGLLAMAVASPASVFNHPTTSSPIALSRNDRLVFVVNPRANTLSVLCAANGNVVATLGVGLEPRSVAVDPDNQFAFVANAADSAVSVIRILNSTCKEFSAGVEKTIKTGAEPW